MDMPGEKLLIRLWETVDSTVCGLLSPWQIRRVGRARTEVEREQKLVLAQAVRDAEDIRAGRKTLTSDGQLIEVTDHGADDPPRGDEALFATLAATTHRNSLSREMRRDVNVAQAILQAEAELENDPQEPPEGRVEEDWLFRWRDSASQVSAEELQILWGRVLAGEIKSPGAFSLRTLEFLKNLSKEDARRIERLAPFVVDDFVFSGNRSLLESEGITLGFLLGLQDLGIVEVSQQGVRKVLTSGVQDKFLLGLVAYKRVLVVTHEDPNKESHLNVYRLTSLGREVLKLGTFTPHESYLRKVGTTIRDLGFRVVVARYEQVTETKGRYFDEEEL